MYVEVNLYVFMTGEKMSDLKSFLKEDLSEYYRSLILYVITNKELSLD